MPTEVQTQTEKDIPVLTVQIQFCSGDLQGPAVK